MTITQITEATKEVTGYFGKPRQITRQDFINRWISHAGDLYNITNTIEQHNEVRTMIARIEDMAGKAWDRIR